MSDKIDVVLKVKNRPYDFMGNFNYWLDTFKDTDRYRILVWDDTKENKMVEFLAKDHPDIPVITKKTFEHTEKVNELVKNSNLAAGWKAAGFAHLATFYIAESDYFWNIDADDIRFVDPFPQDILHKIEDGSMTSNVFAISWDMYWSKNLAFPSHPHHWSLGVAFIKRDIGYLPKMLKLKKGKLPPWAINIDVLFEYAKDYRPVQSFIFEGEMKHTGQSSKYEDGVMYVRHRPEKPWLEVPLYGKDTIIFESKKEYRPKPIKFLVTDCDGTLTDGKYYYSRNGKEMSAFHANDSVAVFLAKKAGVKVYMISSGSYQDINRKRAEDIGMEHIYCDYGTKVPVLKGVVDFEETAYVGDCFDDAKVFKRAALAFAPSDALPEVKKEADIVLERGGGCGCLLEAWLRIEEYNEKVNRGIQE